MNRRATLSGANVCVAFWLVVASVASVVGGEPDGVQVDAATRFLDGGDAADGVSNEKKDATSPTEA
ncbi:MAG: hypothetical protein IJN32_02145, partial [Thermoguttaceae bacterium]|nr:hypothetical protein [Thermoguttaceae bacterium]